jgi:G protein-coupled receptor 107
MAMDFKFRNADSLGNPTYLSAGEMKLPLMFVFFSISYLLCCGIWFVNLREIQKGNDSLFPDSGPRPSIYAIHQIMGVLVFVKFLSIFFESLRFYVIKIHGHAEVWSFIYYSVTGIKTIFLFTVILLIGTGWSFIRPFIKEREKKIILSVLCLQVLNNIVMAVFSQEMEGDSGYSKLAGLLHLVDIICCCMILVPIVWQVNELEKSIDLDTDTDEGRLEREAELESGDKGHILTKLKLFRTFYIVVIAYIYSTRILVYLFASLLDYRHLWVRYFVVEIVTLWFYVSVGLMFRPTSEASYKGVRDNNDDDGRLDEVELLSDKAHK